MSIRYSVRPVNPTLLDELLGVYHPEVPIDALLRTEPGQEPAESAVERLPRNSRVADALEQLTEREQWVIQALYWEQQTLRQLAGELPFSKTQIARIRDEALQKLSELLRDEVAGS